MHLHCETYGQGHPLIILHGLFGTQENWRTLSKSFGQHWQVFALDQRNHGRSPHSQDFTYQTMTDDLHEFMQQHALPSAYVLGHSMGGKVAMRFAVTYPDIVDKLIVVDIAPKVYPPSHDDVFAALYALDLPTLRSRQDADAALAHYLPDLALRQFLLKNLERTESGAFRWRINLDGIRDNYHEILKGFEKTSTFAKPALFIKGANSGYLKENDFVAIRALFPRTQLVTIPGTGHWVHAEAPREFARIVNEFLTSQE
ncbi:MAG: alpha/beta fold hydrolase [Deltaproteobacteria bacterium]|nr:alpha/beta fold hydrolase [Deltaproteobacteria bacterium]